MSVDRVSDAKTGWGPPWLPLLIQIYIPTRNTFLPYILHHTTQLLLARHSKINIFTKENKGINNLWGNHRSTPLRSLLLPCHAIAHRSHQQQPLGPRHPRPSACLWTPQDCLCEGEPLLPGSIWKHIPHSNWDLISL